jgi:hypothetical protein
MSIIDLLLNPGIALGSIAGIGAAGALHWLFPDQNLVFVQALLVALGGAVGAIIEYKVGDDKPKL